MLRYVTSQRVRVELETLRALTAFHLHLVGALIEVRAAVLDVRVDAVGLGAARVLALVVDRSISTERRLVVLAVFGVLVEQLIVRAGLSFDLIVLAVEIAFETERQVQSNFR